MVQDPLKTCATFAEKKGILKNFLSLRLCKDSGVLISCTCCALTIYQLPPHTLSVTVQPPTPLIIWKLISDHQFDHPLTTIGHSHDRTWPSWSSLTLVNLFWFWSKAASWEWGRPTARQGQAVLIGPPSGALSKVTVQTNIWSLW